MDTEQLIKTFTDSILEDAENIMPDDSNDVLQFSQKVNIKPPKPAEKVLLDVSSVNKIKVECEKAKKIQFPYAELFLGIASLLLGAFFSALISGVNYEFNFVSILFYSICPVFGIGTGVAYFFFRKKGIVDIKEFAEKVEEHIQSSDEIGREQ